MKKKASIILTGILAWTYVGGESKAANGMFPTEIESPDSGQEVIDEETHDLYIDGQLQTYTGEPIFHEGILYVPVHAAVRALNEKADIDDSVPYAEGSPYDYLKEEGSITEISGREMVKVDTLQTLGIKAQWLDNPGRLHLETADHLTVDDLRIGDSMEEVEEKNDIHWNTGYGQPADYIGYRGDMQEFTFIDRYGKERSGEVPDLQLEILDDSLSYIIISSSDYETSKGITVGNSLFEVTRVYGHEYAEESVFGKTVYIYHVNGGSLWFIANKDKEVERIGVWGFQLDGYER